MEPGASVEIRLLGPVELKVDGRIVPLGGPRQRALLALLALRVGQTVPADELVEELWSGEPPDRADTTLRSYVSRLRQSLGGSASIEGTNRGYALRVPAEAVDAVAFERLVREGGETLARGAARRARERLVEALALWRGRTFGEVGSDGVLGAAVQRLDELRLLAVEWRLEADLDTGRGAELIEELERLVREQPFRERIWHHLMLALYRAGRQADALAAYHRARAALDEHLGIEPGEELRSLESAILQQTVPPPPAAGDRSRVHDNLPASLTSFIGRDDDLAQVGQTVRRHRLVTLTGVGGVGKTRLALEVARDVAAAFADGVVFVDLAPLADPALVTTQLAGALGIRDSSGSSPVERVLAQVRDQEILVVLDNCEHVRDASAELVAALLAQAPQAHVLATSRVTLGVPGEIDIAVPPLALTARPAGDGMAVASDAADLFLERARAARPSLYVDEATHAAVARIVEDLDGLPLAIELAAARAKALSIGDIAARLGDRFRFLVSWRRLTAARHRTLAEAMAWSFDLLDPAEQALLADLSVFAGSFDLEAIGAICLEGDAGLALDLVQQLVDASLVVAETDRGGSRYRLLETVRQYAMERLGGLGRADASRTAHARYFATVAETTPNRGAEQARGMARLDAELDNLRAAMDTAVELGDEILLRRLTAGLWRYWHVRGLLVEGRGRLRAAVEGGPGDAPDLYAGVLTGAARIAWTIGDYAEGERYAGELLALGEASGSPKLAFDAHAILATLAGRQHKYETSEGHSLRALELGREIDDELSLLMTENNHAALLMDMGRLEEAVPMFEHVLERFTAIGDTTGVAYALLNLGEAAFRRGADDEARRWFADARDAFEAVGFRAHVGHAIQGLAAVEARSGAGTVAAELLGQAAALLHEAGHALDDFNPGMVAGAADAARTAIGEAAYAAAYGDGWTGERRAAR